MDIGPILQKTKKKFNPEKVWAYLRTAKQSVNDGPIQAEEEHTMNVGPILRVEEKPTVNAGPILQVEVATV